ncbi:MAG TPA: WXG100 family type VII secretion target [Pseudonocardiaceae bacterium]|jgi:uncharacterized protein YukE
MTAALTTPNNATIASSLADLTSTGDAVRAGGWGTAGLGTGTGDLGQLAATDSPLSALSDNGFGYVRGMVSFLEEPLHQLAGDPGAVSTAAADAQSAGEKLSSIAASYRSSLGQQTSTWSGTAADSYRGAGTQYADGITTLSQAASTVSSAISGAGSAVAQTAQGVRQDIAEAVGHMLPILAAARAQSGSNGTSLAQAIPECVQIAEAYAQRIAGRMRSLLSSGQQLKALVEKAIQAAEAAVKQAFQHVTGGSESGKQSLNVPNSGKQTGGSGSSGSQGSGSQSGQQSAATSTNSANNAANTSNQPSSDQSSPSALTDSSASTGSGIGTGTSADSSSPTSLSGFTSPSTSSTLPSAALGSGLLGGLHTSSSGLRGSGTGSTAKDTATGIPARSGIGIEAGEQSAAGAAGKASVSAEGQMMGGSPAGRGGRREDDAEHRSPEWLQDKGGLFDADEATPAVIDTPPDAQDEEDFAPRERRTSAVVPTTLQPSATPAASTPVPEPEEQQDKPVKMAWRLSEEGELERVPASD